MPIASFQALQHRMADMAIEARHRPLRRHPRPAGPGHGGTGGAVSASVSGCKALVTSNLKWATAQGIQLHGGYGITEEYAVGHYFRRLLVIDAFFGRRAHHLARYAAWLQHAALAGNTTEAQA